jgi:hypothetical protein
LFRPGCRRSTEDRTPEGSETSRHNGGEVTESVVNVAPGQNARLDAEYFKAGQKHESKRLT